MRLRSRWELFAIVPLALAGFGLLTVVWPPDSGPLALVLILEEHLLIAAFLALIPLALLTRARLLGVALAVLALVSAGLFGGTWLSSPFAAGSSDLTVMTWNVEYGTRTPAEQTAQLEGIQADLIALLEIEPDAAAAIESDATLTARYPYRAMAARPQAWGLAVLSRYPISGLRSTFPPAMLELDLAAPHGRVHVIVGHPPHADIATFTPLRLPVSYEPAGRDSQIAVIRSRIDAALEAGGGLLVLGDFNVAPMEAEYRVLTAALRDTHVEVGQGPGWTWRPSRLTFLPFGLVRIDLQLSGGSVRPISTWTDCSLSGDHCRLFGTYEF